MAFVPEQLTCFGRIQSQARLETGCFPHLLAEITSWRLTHGVLLTSEDPISGVLRALPVEFSNNYKNGQGMGQDTGLEKESHLGFWRGFMKNNSQGTC